MTLTDDVGTWTGGIQTASLNIPLPNGTAVPDVSVLDPTPVGSAGATVQALVRTYGETTTVHVEWGAAGAAPDHITQPVQVVPGTGLSPVALPLAGLAPGTAYGYRIVATNAEGSTTSALAGLTTPTVPPQISLPQVLSVSGTSATLAAVVEPLGADTSVVVQWGATDELGQAGTPADVGAGPLPLAVSSTIDGLLPDHDYRARLVATNANGTTATSTIGFHTPASALPLAAVTAVAAAPAADAPAAAPAAPALAILRTQVAIGSPVRASIAVEVLADAPAVVRVDLGRTTAYGAQSQAVPVGGSAQLTLAGLAPSTTYHYRITLTSPAGTTSTADAVLHTPAGPPRALRAPRLRVTGRVSTCARGTWSAASRYAIAWLRDGVAIRGSHGTTHRVVPADRGATLVCEVTASGAGGTGVARSGPLVIR